MQGLTIVSLPDVLSKDILHRSITVYKCKIEDESYTNDLTNGI